MALPLCPLGARPARRARVRPRPQPLRRHRVQRRPRLRLAAQRPGPIPVGGTTVSRPSAAAARVSPRRRRRRRLRGVGRGPRADRPFLRAQRLRRPRRTVAGGPAGALPNACGRQAICRRIDQKAGSDTISGSCHRPDSWRPRCRQDHGTHRYACQHPRYPPRRRPWRALPVLRPIDDHGALPAGRARRPQAGAPASALRHAPAPSRPCHRLQKVRPRRWRRHRQVPPARGRGGVRRHGALGAGIRRALSAGRWTGQLRQHRRRQRRGYALHGGPPDERGHGVAGGHRRGCRRFPRHLRRRGQRARRAAGQLPEPSCQRRRRDCRRHGDQHPAAQRRRGVRRAPSLDQASAGGNRKAAGNSSRDPISRPAGC